jgi:hypothetical protein
MRAGTFVVMCLGLIGVIGCPSNQPGDHHQDTPHWHLVLKDLPGALISISGTSETDVYAVGGDPGDGKGPMFVHYDGTAWNRVQTGQTGDLWWITDRKLGDSFYLSGEGGMILEYNTATGTFRRFTTPGTQTLFGIWGVSASNLFAVGGDADDPDTGGVLWRYDGTNWRSESLAGLFPSGPPVLWKVWGRGDSDVWVCGERGTILRYDGTTWTQIPSATARTLFTIYGNDTRVVAVGGRTTGVIVELINGTFRDVSPPGVLQMSGVFVPPMGEALTVGLDGQVALGESNAFRIDDTGITFNLNVGYHGAWGDPQGGLWGVGGNLTLDPLTDGVITYYGTTHAKTTYRD